MKNLFKKWWFWLIAIVLVIGIIGSVGGDSDESYPPIDNSVSVVANDNNNNTVMVTEAEITIPTVPLGHKNALDSAKSYIRFSGFSYEGLIDQLEFEGYSEEECFYGANNCGADWNEECYEKAESYLEFMSFSKEGLRDQLEFEGFTDDQINYALEKVGY